MSRIVMIAWALGLALSVPSFASAADTPPAEKIPPALVAFEKGLHKQTGDIVIPEAKATLHLGDRYYFLPAKEAREVITKIWGNPPSVAEGVLGIVIEKGATTYDNVWGAIVTYDPSGYVTDADAKTEDYANVLEQMRSGEAEENAERKKGGYSTIHLVGWAQPPSYDAKNHVLVWARNLAFSGAKVNTLNYDVRLLGREGVLSLNMLSDMDHLADIQRAASDFGQSASFNPGATYTDYNSSTDKSAGYGLAGLVAAGAGLAVAKKLGFLAILLGFGKKFLILFAIAGAALARWFRKIFRRGDGDGVGTVDVG